MTSYCRDKCLEFKAAKPYQGPRYTLGQKRCMKCCIFIDYEGYRCPCCGNVLRTRPRSHKYKDKLELIVHGKW